MDIKPVSFSSIANFGSPSEKKVSAQQGFEDMLLSQINETNQVMQEARDMTEKAALGNAGVDIHDAQIASARADVHFRLMVQVRNKALEAYKEIMNMPV
ncbi:MAG: flagellar hook-basal body complex protein FliE [Magnetococcales bacterium]|nr:flagellar hook-basal body complex protein FliE [Magnetococcales bacterium]NGZ27518.1 flagellar hook-basal body complex protein FliE [Magnetococcales bacterium]